MSHIKSIALIVALFTGFTLWAMASHEHEMRQCQITHTYDTCVYLIR